MTIPASVTTIGDYAFQNCSGLTSVTISQGVTSIGQYAFSGCSGLTGVTIPASVTTIGDYAFQNCSGLTGVTIPASVTSIGSYAFSGCSGLTGVTIPQGVTSIGQYAFSGCSGLTSVTIPVSVTSWDRAFSGCSGLTSVTISQGVTSIGSSAFSGCTGLTSVTIPASVTSIGGAAFSGCTGLTSVTIPQGVTSIGNYAFSGCSKLEAAIFTGNAPGLGTDVFGSAASGFTVYYFSGKTGFTSPTWNGYPALLVPHPLFTWTGAVSGNWSDAAKWTDDQASGTAPTAAGQAGYGLDFNTPGTYTATQDLNAGFLLNQLDFGGSAVTLAGNRLAFTAYGATLPQINQNAATGVVISTPLGLAADLTVGGTGSGEVAITGAITGTGGLSMSNPGTLKLCGDNTYSGGTTITSGTLQVGNGGTCGSLGSGPVVNHAALVINRSDNVTLANNIQGTGSLTQAGTGITTLSGSNSYSGATNIVAGTLRMGANSTPPGILTHRWSFNGNLDDSVGGSTATAVGTASVGVNQVTLPGGPNGTSYVTLGSKLLPTSNAPLTIEIWATQMSVQNWARIFEFGSSTGNYMAMTWSQWANLNSDRIEVRSSSVTTTLDNTLAPYSLNTEYHIAFVLTPNDSGTTINAYKMDGNGNLLASVTTTSSWSLAELTQTNLWLGHSQYPDNDANASYNEVRIWNSALSRAQLSALAAAGPDAAQLSWALGPHTPLQLASGATLDLNGTSQVVASLAGAGGMIANGGAGATLTTGNGNTDQAFTGTIQDATSLVKAGTGIWTLAGNNSYTGTTTVNEGTLWAAKLASLPGLTTPGKISVGAGATLAINVGGTGEFGATDLANLLTNGTFLTTSALGIDTTNGPGGTFTYSPNITKTTSLNKLGAGTLVLSGTANSYTGTTNVAAGTLQVNGSLTGGGAMTVPLGGTLGIGNAASIARNVMIDGGVLDLAGTLAAGTTLTLVSGTVNVSSANASAAALALPLPGNNPILSAPADRELAVTNKLTQALDNNDVLTITAGTPAFKAGGGNLVNNIDKLTLRGGTTKIECLAGNLAAGLDVRGWQGVDGQIEGAMFDLPGSPSHSTFAGTLGYATGAIHLNNNNHEHFASNSDGSSGVLTGAKPTGYVDNYTVEYRGKLYIATAGNYRFSLTSDDGSALWIDPASTNPPLAAAQVQDAGYHSMASASSGPITLTVGYHDIIVRFYEGGFDNGIYVQWDPTGGTNFVDIPGAKFFHGSQSLSAVTLPTTDLAVTATSTLNLNLAGSKPAFGALNLTAGTLTFQSAANVSFDNIAATDTTAIAGTVPLVLRSGNVTVADGKTLTVGPVIANGTTPAALTKLGTGTLVLTGSNTYSGNTTISQGVLSITKTCLADTSTVTIASGALLNLNTAGATDTIASLVLGGVAIPAGTYNSLTPLLGSYFTGTGSLNVLTGPANRPPVFPGYALSGRTDQALSIHPAKILARAGDPDGDAVTLTRVFGPSAQGATVTLAGSVNYTPPAGFAGTDTFEVEIADARGASVRGTVTITLTAAPTGPAALGRNLTDFAMHRRQGRHGLPRHSGTLLHHPAEHRHGNLERPCHRHRRRRRQDSVHRPPAAPADWPSTAPNPTDPACPCFTPNPNQPPPMKATFLSLPACALILAPCCAIAATTLVSGQLVNTVIPDNDGSGLVSVIAFAGGGQTVTSVEVVLTTQNGWNGDMYAYLEHNGVISVLLNRPGRTGTDPAGAASSGMHDHASPIPPRWRTSTPPSPAPTALSPPAPISPTPAPPIPPWSPTPRPAAFIFPASPARMRMATGPSSSRIWQAARWRHWTTGACPSRWFRSRARPC